MNMRIEPHALSGRVEGMIASKSQAHRALICAALADAPTRIVCNSYSQDVRATVRCLEALGARVEWRGDGMLMLPVGYAGQTGRGYAGEVRAANACAIDAANAMTNANAIGMANVNPNVSSGDEAIDTPSPIAAAAPINSADARCVHVSAPLLDCGESGSTLRFMLPLAGALGRECAFTGQGKLPTRPLSPMYEQLAAHGMRMSAQGSFPLRCAGQLSPGRYEIAGNISSQFITGLLMALPLLAGDSELRVIGQLESRPYVDITLDVLNKFGIAIERNAQGFIIPGGQRFKSPASMRIEGDWSSAAFWLAAGALGASDVSGVPCKLSDTVSMSDERDADVNRGAPCEPSDTAIELGNSDVPDAPCKLSAPASTSYEREAGGERCVSCAPLDPASAQGDRAIADVLRRFGARIESAGDTVLARPARLSGIALDASDIPDLVPIIAVVAGAARGDTVISGVSRLRLKESDRICSVMALLGALGVSAEEAGGVLTVHGRGRLEGGTVDSFGDHRIVMAAAVAGSVARAPVTISGAQASDKSYPGFFDIFAALGGRAVEV